MKKPIVLTVLLFGFLTSYSQEATISQEDYNEAVMAYNKGIQHFYDKEYEEALPLLTRATELNPNNSDMFFALSNIYNVTKDLDEAMVKINEALTLEPNQPDYLLHRANVQYKLKNYKAAISDYSDAIKYQIESGVMIDEAKTLYNRGNCHLYLKNYAEAKADFDLAIEGGYRLYDVYHNRATANIRLNKKSEACSDYKAALELGSPISKKYITKYCL